MLCVQTGCGKKAPASKGSFTFCADHRFSRKPVFILMTIKGFGKGWTLKEAVDNFQKANGRLDLKGPYTVHVFKAEKLEDVSVDLLNWSTQNYASHIAQG